jgi:RNA polymerase sigma-70 factor (ECF subfamily)
MLGSLDDAEDLVQDTYLRAWRAYGSFEGRASPRVWLYRIATNACLDVLKHRRRRWLPSDLGAASDDPDTAARATDPEVAWLQPLPDALLASETDDPAEVVASRDSVRVALITSLQVLPARQRAALMLREVLGFPASEVAEMLDTTVPAVKSALQRARTRLEEVDPSRQHIDEPSEPRARELLTEYMAGFENADTTALERALRTDAAIELVGTRTWFAGRTTCLRYLAHVIGRSGDWRMMAATVNAQPAAAAYVRDSEGVHRAWGLGVLDMTSAGIGRIVVFGDPRLVAKCGLPELCD